MPEFGDSDKVRRLHALTHDPMPDVEQIHAELVKPATPWFESRANLVKLLHWLDVLNRLQGSTDVIEVLERPWRWEVDWERLEDAMRQLEDHQGGAA